MAKSIDERLFEQLMRTPHIMRRHCEGGPGPDFPRHGEGHGPHGPMHGMHHGPERPEHGRGPKPGFARERVLGIIAEHGSGVRQKTLCEELRINPSSVSELINKLENDGYVKRTVDPDDGRATLIMLTELGQARAAELEDEQKERFSGLFGNLTEDEKEQLLTLLQKIGG